MVIFDLLDECTCAHICKLAMPRSRASSSTPRTHPTEGKQSPSLTHNGLATNKNQNIDEEGGLPSISLIDRILEKVEVLHRKTQNTAALLRAAQTNNTANARELKGLIATLQQAKEQARSTPESIQCSAQTQQKGSPITNAASASVDASATGDQVREASPELLRGDDVEESPIRAATVAKRRRRRPQSESSMGSTPSPPRRRRRTASMGLNVESKEESGENLQLGTPPNVLEERARGSGSAIIKADGTPKPEVETSLPTPDIVSRTATPRLSTVPGDLPYLHPLHQAMTLLPRPSTPEIPGKAMMPHHGLKTFLEDPKATFSNTIVGKLDGDKKVEFIKINPGTHQWAPKLGRHGALTLVNNEGSSQQFEIYPTLMKDSDGWKYGGEYMIGKSIPITPEIWTSFPFEVQMGFFSVIANSKWGASWLQKHGQRVNGGCTFIRNCLDVTGALRENSDTGLKLAWVIIEFVEYSVDVYEQLARVWNPPRSPKSRKGNRPTEQSRSCAPLREGPVRQIAEGLPRVGRSEVLGLLDEWNPENEEF